MKFELKSELVLKPRNSIGEFNIGEERSIILSKNTATYDKFSSVDGPTDYFMSPLIDVTYTDEFVSEVISISDDGHTSVIWDGNELLRGQSLKSIRKSLKGYSLKNDGFGNYLVLDRDVFLMFRPDDTVISVSIAPKGYYDYIANR